jgi:hypothetical protein
VGALGADGGQKGHQVWTKTAALELAPHNIRVNALAPDLTVTEHLLRVSPNGLSFSAGHMIPMGRPGHVDEMAGAAVFLASDMSSYITGQTIHVDGGTQAASGWYHNPQSGDYQLGPSQSVCPAVGGLVVEGAIDSLEPSPDRIARRAVR